MSENQLFRNLFLGERPEVLLVKNYARIQKWLCLGSARWSYLLSKLSWNFGRSIKLKIYIAENILRQGCRSAKKAVKIGKTCKCKVVDVQGWKPAQVRFLSHVVEDLQIWDLQRLKTHIVEFLQRKVAEFEEGHTRRSLKIKDTWRPAAFKDQLVERHRPIQKGCENLRIHKTKLWELVDLQRLENSYSKFVDP